MAESTLSFEYDDLLREVGVFLGYPRSTYDYTTAQHDECDFIVQSGYRRFLFPEPLREGEPAHIWSFLSPVATIDTAADDVDYDLPDNFGGMVGTRITIDADGIYLPVPIRGEGQIRALYAGSSLSGRPQMVATRVKDATAGTTGQRWELIPWPTPDAVYAMQYRYNVLTGALTRDAGYPLGGMAHIEAILESCLRVAEQRSDDTAGVHTAAYPERLAASVSYDRQVSAPATLGYNSDLSDQPIIVTRTGVATYEGFTYGPFGTAP